MQAPETPANEAERLASLESLHILDTPAEERFDRITRLTKSLFDVPIALISLVDANRQWFKSKQGLTACETSREVSFCGHAILQEDTLWIEDARADERFCGNPLVTGEPRIRFYAGSQLHAPDGRRIGTLCIIDREPRAFSEDDAAKLRDMRRIAESELCAMRREDIPRAFQEREARERRALLDEATGVWNREGILELVEMRLESARQEGLGCTAFLCEVDERALLSERWRADGSEILFAEVAQGLRRCTRLYDSIGRIASGQFLVIVDALTPQEASRRIALFERRVEESPLLGPAGVRLEFAHATLGHETRHASAKDVLQELLSTLAATRESQPAR